MNEDEQDYDLVMPFLTDDPMFVYGFEFCQIWQLMKQDSGVIEGYYTTWNQDHITIAAQRTGWTVTKMEPWEDDDHWTYYHIEKKSPLNVKGAA